MAHKMITVCAALLFVASYAFAQADSVVIEGRVVNAQGIPLSKAIVKAKHAEEGVVTRVDGAFSLKVPAAGDTVVFSKEGLADFWDFFCYNYKGVVIMEESSSSWMSYGQYVKAMEGVAQKYHEAGLKFLQGEEGSEPDYKKAFACFTRAANMEYAPAIYQLGRMFDEGLGVSQNHTSAAIWYQKAARNAKALARLGEMYAEGIGVEQNYQQAANCFFEAEQEGDSVSSPKRLEELLSQGLAKQELLPELKVYDVVEENASFPGGNQACYTWLAKRMRYPRKAQEQGIQGRVIVQFVIDKDGSLRDILVVRSPDPSLSQEAIRLVSGMPKWTPARQGGKPVRSRFKLPIAFNLS